jgi:hypothetical protein
MFNSLDLDPSLIKMEFEERHGRNPVTVKYEQFITFISNK